MSVFLSADQHHSHVNIIDYCNRPFKNAARMTRRFIQNHNDLVTDKDVCYFVGDFYMGHDLRRLTHVLDMMNGIKVLVLGNHDRMRPFDYVEAGFQSVHTALQLDILDGVVLHHDPCVACMFPDKWVICGHVHNLFKVQGNAVNVGVDVWDFKPVSVEQLTTFLGEQRETHPAPSPAE